MTVRWLLLVAGLYATLSGCSVIGLVDAAASAVVGAVETAVDWVIPD